MNEQQAITLCINNRDSAGFSYLFKTFRREAYFHALGFLGNSTEAADACQESFAKAFTGILHLKQLDSFYPWFYTILRNCCLNILSRKKNIIKFEPQLFTLSEQSAQHCTPEDCLRSKEERKLIASVFSMLKSEFREILLLKYVDELDYEQISQRLTIPRGTVMSRLYHARKAFCDAYQSLTDHSGASL